MQWLITLDDEVRLYLTLVHRLSILFIADTVFLEGTLDGLKSPLPLGKFSMSPLWLPSNLRAYFIYQNRYLPPLIMV